MWKSLRSVIVVVLAPAFLFAQALPEDTAGLAAEALALARAGNTERAIEMYRSLAARDPNNMAVMRDYAIVIGWSGKYQDAIPVVDKVLELQARKRALADAIITADNSLIRDLGREELELLLS